MFKTILACIRFVKNVYSFPRYEVAAKNKCFKSVRTRANSRFRCPVCCSLGVADGGAANVRDSNSQMTRRSGEMLPYRENYQRISRLLRVNSFSFSFRMVNRPALVDFAGLKDKAIKVCKTTLRGCLHNANTACTASYSVRSFTLRNATS